MFIDDLLVSFLAEIYTQGEIIPRVNRRVIPADTQFSSNASVERKREIPGTVLYA